MVAGITATQLWNSAPDPTSTFDPSQIADLPASAQRYLCHAISPGTPLAGAVKLKMHGEIKLGSWREFSAEQVIQWRRGMIWAASVKMLGLPVTGSDRLIDGQAEMNWRLLGLIPMMTGSGPEITRSALGRVEGESVWVPSVLLGPDVVWSERDSRHPRFRITVFGETAEIDLETGPGGELTAVRLPRWGNPDGGPFRYVDFGVVVEEERTFGGYTVPSRIRAGWHFGSPAFETTGEFFRAEIDRAEYR